MVLSESEKSLHAVQADLYGGLTPPDLWARRLGGLLRVRDRMDRLGLRIARRAAVCFALRPDVLGWLGQLLWEGSVADAGGIACFGGGALREAAFVDPEAAALAADLEEWLDRASFASLQVAGRPGGGHYWRRSSQGMWHRVQNMRGDLPPVSLPQSLGAARASRRRESARGGLARHILQRRPAPGPHQAPPVATAHTSPVLPDAWQADRPDAVVRNLLSQLSGQILNSHWPPRELARIARATVRRLRPEQARLLWHLLVPRKLREAEDMALPPEATSFEVARQLGRLLHFQALAMRRGQQGIAATVRRLATAPMSRVTQALALLGRRHDASRPWSDDFARQRDLAIDCLHAGPETLLSPGPRQQLYQPILAEADKKDRMLRQHYQGSRAALAQALLAGRRLAPWRVELDRGLSPAQREAVTDGLGFVEGMLRLEPGQEAVSVRCVPSDDGLTAWDDRAPDLLRVAATPDAAGVVHAAGCLLRDRHAAGWLGRRFQEHRLAHAAAGHYDRHLSRHCAERVASPDGGEVLPCGLECLYRRPDALAVDDPEWCALILLFLEGHFRKGHRQDGSTRSPGGQP